MKRLFVLGDSISIQYGPYLQRFLQGKMEYNRKGNQEIKDENLDLPTSLTGNNGGDSSMVLTYLKHLYANDVVDIDYLLLNCGLHDIKRQGGGQLQVALTDYKSNLQEIIKMTKERNVTPIWVRTTPVNDEIHNRISREFQRFNADVEQYNKVADDVMREAIIGTIDLNHFTSRLGESEELYIDHVHFTESVRSLQAAYIAGYLEKLTTI